MPLGKEIGKVRAFESLEQEAALNVARTADVLEREMGQVLKEANLSTTGAESASNLTGELRHHDAIKAANAGMTIVCTLHSNSERGVLKRLAKRLNDQLPDLPVIVSQFDRDPFTVA
jgi:putative NIF3 family GTP cyclohydrolase 1 type 2